MTTNETKRESAIKSAINEAGALVLTFGNGRIIQVHPASLAPDIQRMATLHGLKQKLVDAAAISRNPDTGKSATVADKYDAVYSVYERITSDTPSWNETREGGGNVGGLLLRALIRMQPAKTPEALKAWLETKTDKEKAALRANPKVAAIIDAIRAETVKTDGIDTEELLGELDD